MFYTVFNGLRRWDAVHFLHIARFGYIYESSLAFFPAYPRLFIRPLACLLNSCFTEANAYLLAALSINVLVGFLNSYMIFLVGLRWQLKSKHAFWSAIVYMINPATVFFLAPYSETLFLFSQLCGHFFLQDGRFLFASLAFAVGCSIRSNGIVSTGFLMYYCLKRMYKTRRFILPLQYILLIPLAFVLTQFYQYRAFCFEKVIPIALLDYGHAEQLKMPLTNMSSSWCEKALPFSYGHVQQVYWNVGFLRYWTFKQIPNFLLALPVLYLVSDTLHRWYHLARSDLYRRGISFLFVDSPNNDKSHWLTTSTLVPHLIYTSFLSVVALFCMHVQVSTRFLFSSGPLLYFVCADRIAHFDCHGYTLIGIYRVLKRDTPLYVYCLIYVLLGITFFSNFLPWT
jgi:GPI mannosyltransferase 2